MANLNPTAIRKPDKFWSRKSRQTALAIWLPATLVLLYLAWLLFSRDQSPGLYFIGFIYLIIYGMLAWMWFDTGYLIEEDVLRYHSGPVKGTISIGSIRKIEKKNAAFDGVKPALSFSGILIRYNQYDEIFLSPEDEEGFIEELLKRKEAIEVGSWIKE